MRFEHARVVFRSLKFRLTVFNTLVVLAIVVAALLGVHEGLRQALLKEIDQRLTEDVDEFALTLAEFKQDEERVHEDMDRKARSHRSEGLFMQILDEQGGMVWSSRGSPTLPRLPAATPESVTIKTGSYRLAQRRLAEAGLPAYTVRVGCSLELIDEAVANRDRVMAVVGSVMALIVPLGGYWLARRSTSPIARIIDTASRLRPSRLDERLPNRGTEDELDRLSETINDLLDQIGEYLEQHREFVANAAHELRSPLAAIQSSLDVALNADRSLAEYKELLLDVVEECRSLGALVNQLLLLAENDVGSAGLTRRSVALERLVASAVDMFRPPAEELGIELQTGRLEPTVVSCDGAKVRQVINNLIDNSLKFTPRGGAVLVQLKRNDSRGDVTLDVIDNGRGIDADDLPHIFERFYRGDKSRHREPDTRGSGLGLSICRAIVEAHGGTISAASTPGRGARFTVTLPDHSESDSDRLETNVTRDLQPSLNSP